MVKAVWLGALGSSLRERAYIVRNERRGRLSSRDKTQHCGNWRAWTARPTLTDGQ